MRRQMTRAILVRKWRFLFAVVRAGRIYEELIFARKSIQSPADDLPRDKEWLWGFMNAEVFCKGMGQLEMFREKMLAKVSTLPVAGVLVS